MKVLIVEPLKQPRRAELETLEDMQAAVGGDIENVYPWPELPVALVCDGDGMLKRKKFSRIAGGIPIRGAFFLAGIGKEDYTDLPEELMSRFEKAFTIPGVPFERPAQEPDVHDNFEDELAAIIDAFTAARNGEEEEDDK